jgi:hypothetical protein
MYHLFFKLLNSKFDETAAAHSSPSSRNKSIKPSASTEVSGANLMFRQLCALIPQKHRLSVALFALRDCLGGDDGLRLLVNAPLPPLSPARKLFKNSQSTPVSISANNVSGAIASSKSQVMNPTKKLVKGSTQNNTVANLGSVVPDVAPSLNLGPSWMPIDKYARLAKVIYKTSNIPSTGVRSIMYLNLFFLQYAEETKSSGLLLVHEALIRGEASEWRNWFISDFGPVLPPCTAASCSAFEKLVIVQLCGTLCLYFQNIAAYVCVQVATR